MLDFLEWYFPWSRIDNGLKLQLVIWIASVVFAVWVYVRSIIFHKQWLPLKFARDGNADEPESAGENSAGDLG